ncbi:glycoside hydrolase family 88 protein [Sphingobacterium cellulitidis]|uniref:glycoside hydrolase family 88 protein n=1 Tax=Sphingobacterium cellulitidis TaxID=1768011 RepID=UPI0015C5CDAA|nr:glycoside hydrolase family 88 protein [Sphingobacterium cellulitidis]
MKIKITSLFAAAASVLFISMKPQQQDFIPAIFKKADKQYQYLAKEADVLNKFPRTTKDGKLIGTDEWDWTGGFFPGSLWYIYHQTANEETKAEAIKWTEKLEKAKDLDQHHDIGFVMYCSYGNAIKYLNDPAKVKEYKDLIIHSSNTALKRYDAKVGVIKSWNEKKSWDNKTVWKYPVIIDNMMNLEMLCYTSDITGDPKYKEVAISHADQTMKNHFRSDYSTYHVVDYDANGKAIHQQTNQGFADNSTWSRGQAWAIYGFTMMYRETKKADYLATAQKAAKFYMNNSNLPKDKIPYWDFNAHQKGYNSDVDFTGRNISPIPRDASAAAIVASALIELSQFSEGKDKKQFLDFSKESLKSLSSPAYFADYKTNGGFLLKHSVGSLPHNSEVDGPLTYADYYYLEALTRLKELK